MKQNKKLLFSLVMLLVSAIMLSTASFAWFSMNTDVKVEGIEFEAYSDSLFLEISDAVDGPYGDYVDVSSSPKAIRPSSIAYLTDDGAWTADFDAATGDYDPDVTYYARVSKSQTNDSFSNPDYIVVETLREASLVEDYYMNPEFVLVSTTRTPESGVTYYEKQGNAYVPATRTDVYGLYTLTNPTDYKCDSGERFVSGNVYYSLKDGVYAPVGGLKVASSVDGCYTLKESARETVSTGGDYYVLNNRGDYISIGTVEVGVKLDSTYRYTYTAYSDTLNLSQGDNLDAVIDESIYTVENIPYYLYDTVYLRMANGANNGDNIKVSAVEISGSDSLDNAIRVLLVAKNGMGEISRAIYNHRDGTIEHIDDTGRLFSTILGDEEEIIEVEIFVYYDGSDDDVVTNRSVVLTGHVIKCTFSIDVPEYLQHE